MSYRVGHHSTSDDSSAYRSPSAVASIQKNDSPLTRLRLYLESFSPPLWSQELEDATKSEYKKEIMLEFNRAEKEKRPPLSEMFGDVWANEERPIREQREELKRLVRTWGEASESWKKELSKFDGGRDEFLKD
jgi:2-oxoisovalerate dehydrogenase E1 component alpha subunit